MASFISTYRYALLHLLGYNEGISLYFSQLSLEQKIFIAFDIISMGDQRIYKYLCNNKILKSELLTQDVIERSSLIKMIYEL